MTLLDFPLEARLRGIEDRLAALEQRVAAIERDLAVIETRLDEISQRIPSVWLIVGLILPLYAVFVLGFVGLGYFLLNYVKPGG